MNSANFEKWIVEKLVHNLPLHAVIVLDNTPITASRMKNHSKPVYSKATLFCSYIAKVMTAM